MKFVNILFSSLIGLNYILSVKQWDDPYMDITAQQIKRRSSITFDEKYKRIVREDEEETKKKKVKEGKKKIAKNNSKKPKKPKAKKAKKAKKETKE